MNILPFHLNVPAEITLERPEGTLVQGRYGDRVMFSLSDGRVMYVPPFVASKIQAEGVAAGERFELCKTQVKKGSRRSIEWIVRRLDPFEELACTAEPDSVEASGVADGSEDSPAPEPEPETPLTTVMVRLSLSTTMVPASLSAASTSTVATNRVARAIRNGENQCIG